MFRGWTGCLGNGPDGSSSINHESVKNLRLVVTFAARRAGTSLL
jgi:hypothetical protein